MRRWARCWSSCRRALALDRPVHARFYTTLRRLWPEPIVLEPRHSTWFTPQVEAWLRDFQIARVAADPARHPTAGRPGGGTGPNGGSTDRLGCPIPPTRVRRSRPWPRRSRRRRLRRPRASSTTRLREPRWRMRSSCTPSTVRTPPLPVEQTGLEPGAPWRPAQDNANVGRDPDGAPSGRGRSARPLRDRCDETGEGHS